MGQLNEKIKEISEMSKPHIFHYLGNSKSENRDLSCSHRVLTENSELAEFYFSWHERMINDDASKDNPDHKHNEIFPNSFMDDNYKGN